jgi:hypothetical protein
VTGGEARKNVNGVGNVGSFKALSKKPQLLRAEQIALNLIEAMYVATEAAQPITGRGVAYKLFVTDLIASMARSEMARVYRLLREARERGIIPWDWIVGETRELERCAVWDDPEQYARTAAR